MAGAADPEAGPTTADAAALPTPPLAPDAEGSTPLPTRQLLAVASIMFSNALNMTVVFAYTPLFVVDIGMAPSRCAGTAMAQAKPPHPAPPRHACAAVVTPPTHGPCRREAGFYAGYLASAMMIGRLVTSFFWGETLPSAAPTVARRRTRAPSDRTAVLWRACRCAAPCARPRNAARACRRTGSASAARAPAPALVPAPPAEVSRRTRLRNGAGTTQDAGVTSTGGGQC